MLFAVVQCVVLAVHLLAMNVAAAGPLVCIWLAWRRTRGDASGGEIGRSSAWLSLWLLVGGIVLGFALVGGEWLRAESTYMDVLGQLPRSAYMSAAAELVFSVICLAIYVATWEWGRRHPYLHALPAVLASTNLVYHFPPLMFALTELAARPELIVEDTLTRPLVRQHMARPEVVSKTVHFALASLSVTGVAVMMIAKRVSRGDPAGIDKDGDKIVTWGGRIALVATLAQLPVGLWVLLELPAASRNAAMGGDPVAAVLLGGSLLGTFALMHALAAVALGESTTVLVRRSAWLTLLIVLLMSALLVVGRRIT